MRDLSQPTQPCTAIQDRMREEMSQRAASTGPAPSLNDDDGAPATLRRALAVALEEITPDVLALSHDIHDHPETGYEEFHAVAAVADLLRKHGIEPQVGVYGMDTALRAEIGGAGTANTPETSTIAILCEYDALPGIGHGCGHNVMAANSVGAFLALHALETATPGSLPGRVVLQTTPAEENSTAKEVLSVRGMLDGVDAAIQTHSYNHDVTHQTWLGVRRMRVRFSGVPAHASSQPFMGRNALDAATLALNGLALLRQQILPMDRVHAVVVDGGEVANIIPERTELSVMVRSKYTETLKDLVGRVENVFQGAALMTGTGVEILTDDNTNEMPVRDNHPLLASWTRAQRERGRAPLAPGVLTETVAAGTDFGNVSLRVPGIHPLIKVAADDIALHTRAMTEAAGSPAGDRGALDGAYGLACVAADYLHDGDFRARVRADFEAAGGVVDVENFWESNPSE